jgi:hypothetical protein
VMIREPLTISSGDDSLMEGNLLTKRTWREMHTGTAETQQRRGKNEAKTIACFPTVVILRLFG